jgi:hypothetical protein
MSFGRVAGDGLTAVSPDFAQRSSSPALVGVVVVD